MQLPFPASREDYKHKYNSNNEYKQRRYKKRGYKQRRLAHEFGIFSEQIAVWYLRFKGYRILAQRHKNIYGEIDILAKKGKDLVVVEVKARQSFEECDESVTAHKRQKIIRALGWILAGGGVGGSGKISGLSRTIEHNIRFDVIWIVRGMLPRHTKNAWRI